MATTIASSKPSLTSNDAAVLQALFDAESAPSAAVVIDPTLPTYPSTLGISTSDQETLKARELAIVRRLETSEAADIPRESIIAAISDFDALIRDHPTYPSAYANRAQAYRMLIEHSQSSAQTQAQAQQQQPQDPLYLPANSDAASRLLADLGQAITLATPKSPADPVSTTQAKLLADIHTHRGYLLLKAARIVKNEMMFASLDGTPSTSSSGTATGHDTTTTIPSGPDRLRGLSADQLEEMASRDFFFGGRFGNKIAQQLAVQTNPYAKMCGAIVKEALRKEVEGDIIDES